jgi:hypothetical protein
MPQPKCKTRKASVNMTGRTNPIRDGQVARPEFDDDQYLPQPKLRRMFGNPSEVTWWRWRHDPAMGCPPMKEVNGRKYGSLREWQKWWAQRNEVA